MPAATSVEEYLADVPSPARATPDDLRAMIKAAATLMTRIVELRLEEVRRGRS